MQLANGTVEKRLEEVLEQNAKLHAQNEQNQVELRLLSEQVKYLKQQLFGVKRERPVDHPELFEWEAQEQPPEVVAKTKVSVHTRNRQHPGRHAFPEHLPREVVEVPLEDGQKICGQCGAEKATLPPEIIRELERVPAKLFVKEYHRQKCACRECHGEITTAAAPSRPIEKGIAGPGLLAQVVVDKFADHMPLYRQEQRFKREGVRLSRKTLCGWLPQLNQNIRRIVEVMKRDLLQGGYIQADETPVPVQNRKKSGKNHRGFMWPYSRPGGPVVFDFRMNRSREGPMKFLEGYEGILQHDGYAAYLHVLGKIIHVACMAHIRRKFWEAHQLGEQQLV